MKTLLKYCIWALIIAGLAATLPDPLVVKPPKLFLKLWFKTANKGLSQLYWNASGNYREEDSEKSTIYAQNRFISQKYMLPEKYSQLRFDPFSSAGTCEIKDIAIVDIDDKPVRSIDIAALKPLNQIADFRVADGTALVSSVKNATDPTLIIEDAYEFQHPFWYEKYATNIKTFVITFAVMVVLGYLADLSDQAVLEEEKQKNVSSVDDSP